MSGKKITKQQATELCNDFDKKYAELSNFIKKDDNRSVLFSLEELKEYISYIENNKNHKINGIRVYLGSNKETNLTTVFLSPTENGKDITSLDAYNFGDVGDPVNNKYGK